MSWSSRDRPSNRPGSSGVTRKTGSGPSSTTCTGLSTTRANPSRVSNASSPSIFAWHANSSPPRSRTPRSASLASKSSSSRVRHSSPSVAKPSNPSGQRSRRSSNRPSTPSDIGTRRSSPTRNPAPRRVPGSPSRLKAEIVTLSQGRSDPESGLEAGAGRDRGPAEEARRHRALEAIHVLTPRGHGHPPPLNHDAIPGSCKIYNCTFILLNLEF